MAKNRSRAIGLGLILAIASAGARPAWSGEEEGLPKFDADSLHVSDVRASQAQVPQASAAALAPAGMPLMGMLGAGFKIHFRNEHELPGPPCGHDVDFDRAADLPLSPAYQALAFLLKSGVKPDPEDLAGDWKLVSEVRFGRYHIDHSIPVLDGRWCLGYDVDTDPGGIAKKLYADRPWRPRLEFAGQSVAVRDHYFLVYGSDTPDIHNIPGSVSRGADAIYLAIPEQESRWECRALPKDRSKLICETGKDPRFVVYARDEAAESLEAMGAVLKPFVPPATPDIHLTRPKPKN